MEAQITYSGDLPSPRDSPWVVLLARVVSADRHPHERACPERRLPACVRVSLPHEQRQRHSISPPSLAPAWAMTASRPKVWPVKSKKLLARVTSRWRQPHERVCLRKEYPGTMVSPPHSQR